jgi:hypothetical protein
VATVTPDATGFIVTVSPKASLLLGGPPPTLRARYTRKELTLVVAAPDLASAALAALDGDGATLKEDAAHAQAMKALRSGAHAYAWVDLGRAGTIAYAASPEARANARGRGFPVDAVHLEGADRLTAALDLDYHAKGGVWTVDVETLNLWGAGLIVAWKSVPRRPSSAAPSASAGHPASPPDAGVPASVDRRPVFAHALEEMQYCSDVLTTLERCAANAAAPEDRDAYMHEAEQRRAEYVRTVPVDRPIQDKACLGKLYRLRSKPECKP